MLYLGSHVSLSGIDQFLGSVKEALSYGSNCFMVYTGAPQNTARKPIDQLKINEAQLLMKEHKMDSKKVIVHAPYIVNLANPSLEKRQFAIAFLTEELKRTYYLGSKILVLHPGAHLHQGHEIGMKLISEGIIQILNNTPNFDVTIALEGMAGKGTEVGRSFEELSQILLLINRPNRTGICLDTCHLNDAGYDVTNHFDDVLQKFDEIVGLSNLKVLHINDSLNELNAHKDRHANIGFGFLGFDAINAIVNHPKLEEIIKILETPYIKSKVKTNVSYPPYKFEIQMLKDQTFSPTLKEDVINEFEGV